MSGSCGVVNPYMNKKARKGESYEPTKHEHVANIATHGVVIVPAIYVTHYLILEAYRDLQHHMMIIYAVATVLLFLMSTLYHLSEYLFRPGRKTLRYYLHITDRVMIYFFIAATANPWLSLRHSDFFGKNLKWIIWAAAIFGICYQFKFHERFKTLETFLYVIISSLPFLAMLTMNDRTGLPLMFLGGAVYAVGVVFFKMDGIIPFSHAIWHCFVVIGASIHTYAVYQLLGPDRFNPFPNIEFTN
uniref:Hemolysin III n=1 Tax=Panagrolaimus sp. JU765 TaxID=591449 RepID=A0AC34QFM6_9BILA